MIPMRSTTLAIVLLAFATVMSAAASELVRATDVTPGPFLVNGTVTDAATGRPIADATVVADVEGSTRGSGTHDSTMTDSAGRYALDVGSGDLTLTATRDGYVGATRYATLDGPATFDLSLSPGPSHPPTIEGTVRDAATGKPVEGATVSVSPGPDPRAADVRGMPCYGCPYPKPGSSTVTDGNGHYTIETATGAVTLAVAKGDYVTSVKHLKVDPGEALSLDIKLKPFPKEDAFFHGTVVDRDTGVPIPNAAVSVTNLEVGRGAWNSTDADGRFEMRLFPGLIDVHVQVNDAPPPCLMRSDAPANSGVAAPDAMVPCLPAAANANGYYEWTNQIVLGEGDDSLTAKMIPKPGSDVTLVGYVVDADGLTGVPRAWVSVQNLDTGEYGNAQTDADGSFKIPVRAGHLVLTASAPDYFARSVFVSASGPATVRRDLILHPGETTYGGCGWGGPCYAVADAKGAPPPAAESKSGPASSGATTSDSTGVGTAFAPTAAGVAAYHGSGGGLGPYDANTAPGDEAVIESAGTANVPGLGVLAIVGLLGAVASLVPRRRP